MADIYGHRSGFVNLMPEEFHQKQLNQNEPLLESDHNQYMFNCCTISCDMDTDQEFSMDNYKQAADNGINQHCTCLVLEISVFC